ncbi:MAG: hypothetical protein DRO99_03070 [Candidatus Aenigmatarchaeota archaeon]|nr:MAG: hypothetical protein DRO99_03070 [Candidatus Aenigmarchaeota archaeon]
MTMLIDVCMEKDSLWKHEFVDPVQRAAPGSRVVHMSDVTEQDIGEADSIIICGTALMDNEYMKHWNDFGWLKRTDVPVLGICAGAHIISKIFGGSICMSNEIGMVEIRVTERNDLFRGTFHAYELHNSAASLPRGFIALAESDKCLQAFRHASKDIYGVLFHPEVRNTGTIARFLEKKKKDGPGGI